MLHIKVNVVISNVLMLRLKKKYFEKKNRKELDRLCCKCTLSVKKETRTFTRYKLVCKSLRIC